MCIQLISQDPSPPIGTIFSLLKGEESRRQVVSGPLQLILDHSALVGNLGGGRG